MRKLLNVSNHTLTEVQVAELRGMGYEIIELSEGLKAGWSNLTPDNYEKIVDSLMLFCKMNNIEGMHLAGFMPAVQLVNYQAAKKEIETFYAYSERVSIEEVQTDGSVLKKSIFQHKGFHRYLNWIFM